MGFISAFKGLILIPTRVNKLHHILIDLHNYYNRNASEGSGISGFIVFLRVDLLSF